MHTPRENLKARLRASTARLLKLIDLDAPAAIIQGEAQLIYNRAKMLGPLAFVRNEAVHWRDANAYRYGFCALTDCENPPVGDYADPKTRPQPGALCQQHTDELALEDAAEEAEYQAADIADDDDSDAAEPPCPHDGECSPWAPGCRNK